MSHSLVGGSSVGRILACPASLRLTKGIPQVDSSNEFTRRGTALHELIEIALATHAEPEELGKAVGAIIEGHEVTQDDVEQGLLPAYLSVTEHHEGLTAVMLERMVTLPGVTDAYGTADFIGWNNYHQRPVVLDFKFGQGVMVSPDTAQLRFYAAAAMYDPELADMFTADTVELAVVQPNDRGLATYRSVVVDKVELFDFTRKVKHAVEISDRADFTPGEHCRWCPAKLQCPRLQEQTAELPQVSRENLSEMLDRITALESWITEVRETAHKLLEAGQQVPGYKLVYKQPRRYWIDETKALKRLTALGLAEQATETKLRSPAQVEKIAKVPLDDLIERRSSGTVVVPETDRREAVTGHETALEKLAQQHSKRS